MKILYLTDVEGMWPRLASFCAKVDGVTLDERAERLDVDDGFVLVFGGDAIDRGPDSRRVQRTLLDAARRQPERVVLLSGNRDLNKMRLRAELASDASPARLRSIFENTMGARAAFEHRRTELARERGVPRESVDDRSVVESYVEEAKPGGATAAYLGACRLAWRMGSTLFVHGGVTAENLGVVPHRPRLPVRDVDAWVEALNAFHAQQVSAFADGAPPPAYRTLVAYQAPTPGKRVNMESVVYARTTDAHNNLEMPPDEVADALVDAGIRRVVLGHTPNGDTPSLVRDRGVAVVVADNSHARHDEGTRLVIDGERLFAEGSTVLDDAKHVEPVRLTLDSPDDDSPLGLRVEDDGHLVKGQLSSGDWLLYKALPGFETEQRAISGAVLRAKRLVRARSRPR